MTPPPEEGGAAPVEPEPTEPPVDDGGDGTTEP